jgi:restriction endonuclease S subunit
MAKISLINLRKLYGAYRWDAECYEPDVLRDENALAHFRTVKLGDIAYITDGQHGYHEVDEESAVRHITAQCVEGGVVTDTKADRLSKKTHDANPRSQLKAGDVLLSTAGTIGEAGVVCKDILPANIDQDVARIALNSDAPIDPNFLVAFLRSELGQFQCRRATTGQIQGHISLAALREFEVPLLREREATAALMKLGIALRQMGVSTLAEAERILIEALGIGRFDLSPRLFYTRRISEITTAGRLDAEYFSPRYQRVLKALGKDGRCIRDVADLAERRFRPEELGKGASFHYIEIGSVRADGLADAEVIEASEAPSRAQWIVEPGDVVTSTVRPIRRLSALIAREQSGYVCSSGFAVLRPKEGPHGIEAEVLLTYLRLPLICEILDLHTTASMYPAISTARLMNIPVAVPNQSVRDEIISKVRSAIAARAEATRLLDEAKAIIERAVLSGSA